MQPNFLQAGLHRWESKGCGAGRIVLLTGINCFLAKLILVEKIFLNLINENLVGQAFKETAQEDD